jgi:hypothetical protein
MRRLLLLLTLLFVLRPATTAQAQDSTVTRKASRWYIPDTGVLQYAGSIGFLSAGAGYSVFRDRAHVDLLFGVVPGTYAGGSAIETITLKFTATPWRIPVGENGIIHPFSLGTFFCYTPGREYSSDLPSWYPSGYYWWSEAIRVNVFLGGNVSLRYDRFRFMKQADFYYEVGTNEIKLVSYIQNTGYLSFGKIIHLGVGLRVHIAR